MNDLLRSTVCILLLIITGAPVNAQQRYDNIYNASSASMVQVLEGNRIEHILKGATVVFPMGTNKLNVLITIPYYAVTNEPVNDSGFVNPGYQFRLQVNIDANEIQQVLTSAKTFTTQGVLTLNDSLKEVGVSYIPMSSGTEEEGNFNISMSIRFKAADFNLDVPDSKKEFVISINNARVNRI